MDDTHSETERVEPEERDRVTCFACGEGYVVEHVAKNEAWACSACAHPNLNLHTHFLVLGIAFAVLAVAGLGLTVSYAITHSEQNVTFLYLMWSAVQTTVSGYVVLAIFNDRRAYGLRALRYLLPGLYASAVAAAIVYWFVFEVVTVIAVGLAFVGLGLYGAYVFWHTLRMSVPHRPRESVVRPVYALVSVTVHVVLMLYMGLATVLVPQPTPGRSSVEFARPGGYVPQSMRIEELDLEDEPELEEQEIELELEHVEPPEVKEIEYTTENEMAFTKIDVEEKPRMRKQRQRRNVHYEQRFNRRYALELGGGTLKTEDAVLAALRWLREHQNPDGSWGEPPIQTSMTGLALLCFLGHGEDDLSEEFGETVRKAIIWLISRQDDDGFFTKVGPVPPEGKWVYQHGIATYAMAEAYGVTGLEDLRPVVAKAVRRICEGQTPEGGWYYAYQKVLKDGSPWRGGDTSISGWQIQALTAAWYAGIRFSNDMLSEARRRAIGDIKSRFGSDVGFGYIGTDPGERRTAKENYSTTAVGTLCLQFLGEHDCREVKGGLHLMRRYSCTWTKTAGGEFGPVYGWYYVTQAMYQATDDPRDNVYWKYWNPLCSTMLVERQRPDGHWDYPTGAAGSWEDTCFKGTNKAIYTTAMCCLMLEVYYRYLPTYRPQR